MPSPLDSLKQYADVLGKGAMQEMMPDIITGALLNLLESRRIDVPKVVEMVDRNRSLWDGLDEKQRNKLKKVARRVGNLDWITADWAIGAISKKYPAVASYVLATPEAYDWMEGQVEELKTLVS